MSQTFRCDSCGAPIKPNAEQCEYCLSWFKSENQLQTVEPRNIDFERIMMSSSWQEGIGIMIASIAGAIILYLIR